MNFLSQDSKILETLWEYGEIGLALVDKDGRFLKVNPKFCLMLEYTEEELLTKNFQSITHPDDLFNQMAASKSVEIGEKHHYTITKRYLPKSGDCVVWAKLHVEAIKNPDGGFMFFLNQVGDFAVQRKSEQTPTQPTQNEPSKDITVVQVLKFIKENWKFLVTILTLVGTIGYKTIGISDRLDHLEHTIKENTVN